MLVIKKQIVKTTAELNIPVAINTIDKRLSYFARQIKLSTDRHSDIKSGRSALSETEWLSEHKGWCRELANAIQDAELNAPPCGEADKEKQFVEGKVIYPPDLDGADAGVKIWFLLNLAVKFDGEESLGDWPTLYASELDVVENDISQDVL